MYTPDFERTGFYRLDENEQPVPMHDMRAWGEWMEDDNRRVAFTQVEGAEVSTVFLGMDHGMGPDPVLWETMIFGGEHDNFCRRYTSAQAARIGHAQVVARLRTTKGTQRDALCGL